MGVSTALLVGAGIAAAGGLAGSAISSAGAKSTNQAALGFNEWSQKDAQAYNTQMYERQLADQESMYNKYQSPQAIAKQLRSAGINPSAVFGSGKGMTSGLPSVPAAASSPALSAPSLVNPYESYGNTLSQVSDSISKLSQSKVSLEQNKSLIKKMESEYDLNLAKTQSEQAIKVGHEIDNSIRRLYGADEVKERIGLMTKQATLAQIQGNYTKAQECYQNLLTELGKLDYKKNEIELQTLGQTIALQQRLLKLQGNAEIASASASYASAGKSIAETKTIDSSREFDVDTARQQAKDLANRVGISNSELQRALIEAEKSKNILAWRKKYPYIAQQLDEFRYITGSDTGKTVTSGGNGISMIAGYLLKALK